MGRENGGEDGLHRLWGDDEQPIPLGTDIALSLASNGDQPSSAAPVQPRRTSADELTAERVLRTATEAPPSGWRRTVFRITGGLVDVGPGPGEQRERELRSRVKTPVAGCRRIAFLSRKGGVGKTSTCLLAGHTFALHRGDRVVCLDANPDAGTLGHRLRRETAATVTTLLGDAGRIERYADIRAKRTFGRRSRCSSATTTWCCSTPARGPSSSLSCRRAGCR